MLPWPQNGSTTTRVPIEARKRTAASHAAAPIARDHDIAPSSGSTSGVEAPEASRRARLVQRRCA